VPAAERIATFDNEAVVVKNDRAWLSNLLDHVPDVVNGVGDAYAGITSRRLSG
jgi:hypothetical protein